MEINLQGTRKRGLVMLGVKGEAKKTCRRLAKQSDQNGTTQDGRCGWVISLRVRSQKLKNLVLFGHGDRTGC